MEDNKQIKLNFDKDDLKGRYSNLMNVTHSKEEFVLDFFNVFPPVGQSVARVVVSPGHMKRMLKVLESNLKNYEKNFSNIEEADEPPKGVGFTAGN